ncbi:MAG: polysaccharide pyruvyl transferase family protein, partial [Armatimonadota bacterium]
PATALPCLLAAASGADVFLVGMGAPTIDTYFARTLVRRLLRRARWITARDDMSFKALQELASDAEGRVIRGADTALALSRSGAVDRDRMRTDGDHVRIGLMLRDWIPRHRERGLAHLLPVALRRRILRFRDPTAAERLFWADLAGACRDLLSMDEAIELCFLPMWPGRDDLRARRFVADHLSEVDSDRICIWRPTDDPIQMLHSIQSLDCVISMRLHALIFAALSGVPAVALSCAVKQDEFMRQIEGSDRIFSVYDFEADRFVAGVSEVVADGAQVAARQSENLGAMANIALRDLTRLQFEIRLRTESAGVAAFGQ